MSCTHRRHKVLSAGSNGIQDWVASGLVDRKVFCASHACAVEQYLANGVTQAEIMEYLSQTYGPVFVADLIKRLSQAGEV